MMQKKQKKGTFRPVPGFGMVLGVPTFAVLYSLVSDWLALALKRRGVDEYGHPLPPEECLPPEAEETAPPTE